MADLQRRFNAVMLGSNFFKPLYHATAFTLPYIPVIANEDPDHIQLFQWGLIPFWVKNEKIAQGMRMHTFNAKAETIFEKPSFRTAIKTNRCLILVDGFYEWHELKKKKYPYYIRLSSRDAFALAGIWDSWTDKNAGKVHKTCSVITTQANSLLERIHNTRKRMPVILKKEKEGEWLQKDLTPDQIKSFFEPYNSKKMEAFPVSKLITAKGVNSNVPEVQKEFHFAELSKTM
jgi:putative SOS response-associated peptidase YedK